MKKWKIERIYHYDHRESTKIKNNDCELSVNCPCSTMIRHLQTFDPPYCPYLDRENTKYSHPLQNTNIRKSSERKRRNLIPRLAPNAVSKPASVSLRYKTKQFFKTRARCIRFHDSSRNAKLHRRGAYFNHPHSPGQLGTIERNRPRSTFVQTDIPIPLFEKRFFPPVYRTW